MSAVLEQLHTWQAVSVALLGAVLWSLPINGRWRLWQHSVGLLLVLVVGLATACISESMAEVTTGALQGMFGYGVSRLLGDASVLTHAAGREVSARRRR